MKKILERGRPDGRALRKMPFLLPLNAQCTMMEPSQSLIQRAEQLEGGDVLNVSYLAGFPPSDLFECGPSVAVHAYGEAAANAAANAMAREIALKEPEFAQPMLEPDDAVREAMR